MNGRFPPSNFVFIFVVILALAITLYGLNCFLGRCLTSEKWHLLHDELPNLLYLMKENLGLLLLSFFSPSWMYLPNPPFLINSYTTSFKWTNLLVLCTWLLWNIRSFNLFFRVDSFTGWRHSWKIFSLKLFSDVYNENLVSDPLRMALSLSYWRLLCQCLHPHGFPWSFYPFNILGPTTSIRS